MKRILILLIPLFAGGCVNISYTDTYGRKFTYSGPAWGTKTIRELDLTKGTLKGYSSEQPDYLPAVVEAAVNAGAKLVRP